VLAIGCGHELLARCGGVAFSFADLLGFVCDSGYLRRVLRVRMLDLGPREMGANRVMPAGGV
jgi:hypothetical protein